MFIINISNVFTLLVPELLNGLSSKNNEYSPDLQLAKLDMYDYLYVIVTDNIAFNLILCSIFIRVSCFGGFKGQTNKQTVAEIILLQKINNRYYAA